MVEFTETTVRKSADPSLLAAEIEKTHAAARLGQSTGLFTVPQILRSNLNEGWIEMERIRGYTPLVKMCLENAPDVGRVVGQAAEALAVIHKHLALDDVWRIPFPPEWMNAAGDHLFLHGDYTPLNVGMDRLTGQLVILDWSPTPYLRSNATFGPRYYDVAWFVLSAFTAMARLRQRHWTAPTVCDHFLRAYFRGPSAPLNADLLRRCMWLAWRLYWTGVGQRLQMRPWYKKPLFLGREACTYLRLRLYRTAIAAGL